MTPAHAAWEFRRPLLRRAYSLCHNWHDAEDLVSEVFLTAVRAAPKDGAEVKWWLFTVLRNRFYEYKRDPFVKLRDDEEHTFDEIIQLPDGYDRVLLRQALEYLENLPKAESSLLLLAALGNDQWDISKRAGISVAAAQSRVSRVVRKVRSAFDINEPRQAAKKSQYIGVTPHQGKWRVRFRVGKRMISKAGFATEYAAAVAYNDLVVRHNPKAPLNSFPEMRLAA